MEHRTEHRTSTPPPDHESESMMNDEPPPTAKPEADHALSSLTIDLTENGGYSVRTSYKQPQGTRGDGPTPYLEGKSYAFSSRGELDDFLDDQLGVSDESDEAMAQALPPEGSPIMGDEEAERPA